MPSAREDFRSSGIHDERPSAAAAEAMAVTGSAGFGLCFPRVSSGLPCSPAPPGSSHAAGAERNSTSDAFTRGVSTAFALAATATGPWSAASVAPSVVPCWASHRNRHAQRPGNAKTPVILHGMRCFRLIQTIKAAEVGTSPRSELHCNQPSAPDRYCRSSAA